MVIYADTSFLFALYGSDVHSPRAVARIAPCTVPIRINVLTRYEFENALRFAEFRRAIKPGQAARFLAQFEAAITHGRIIVETSNLVEIVAEARRISTTQTLTGGHRGFDILHVASALQLSATEFLTFDVNQKQLAQAEGLHVPL